MWRREAVREQAAEQARSSMASMLVNSVGSRVEYLEKTVLGERYFHGRLTHADAMRFCRQIEFLVVEIELVPGTLGLNEVECEVWGRSFEEAIERLRKLETFVLDNAPEPVWAKP
jgi:hypothetical protein